MVSRVVPCHGMAMRWLVPKSLELQNKAGAGCCQPHPTLSGENPKGVLSYDTFVIFPGAALGLPSGNLPSYEKSNVLSDQISRRIGDYM